jgi:hypothetical protein
MNDTILVPTTSLVLDVGLVKRYNDWMDYWSNYADLIRQSSPYEYPMVDFATGLVIDGTGLVVLALSLDLPQMPIVLIDAAADLLGPRT